MPINLHSFVLLLAAAVITVVVCRRFKLPAMLGYLLVGMLIGPFALGFIQSSDEASHLAEYGIVFLMFTLGLEFNLAKLNAMKRIVFGLGAAQVGAVLVLIAAAVMLAGLDWKAGLVLGAAAAMSSTAMVSKLLSDRGELNASHGQNAIGILLFQDLAVVPFLIIIPALSLPDGTVTIPLINLQVDQLLFALFLASIKIVFVLVVLLSLGQKLMRPWFNLVAKQHSSELFMINILLITLGIAWLTEEVGLSLALGAFLAGMLIAETEYRYQVEDDIRPFRDLLLGLFFVTVGMNLNFSILISEWGMVLLSLILLGPVKIGVIAGLAKLFGSTPGTSLRTGFALGQGGEFAFVLLALIAQG
ncbi:MAG: monovalent cation:proton antiporter-2 (CPA2) family protein, partial [Deefgea sp.]